MVLRWSYVRSTLATITLLVVTACGSNADSDADQTASPTAATSDQPTVAPGVPEALRFRAPLVGGGELDMSTLAGLPVVLWFWAPY